MKDTKSRKKYIKPGIYKLVNVTNGKFYIGSSSYLPSRKSQHFSLLKKNVHLNPYLQNSFNKYGIENFQFIIIHECIIKELESLEQYYIDLLKPPYNIRKIAKSNLGWFHSEETKSRITGTVKSNWTNEDFRKKTIEGHYKAIVCYTKDGDFYREFNSAKEASIELGIFSTNITSVLKKKVFSVKGFQFFYKTDNYPLKVVPAKELYRPIIFSKGKVPVLQYDLEGNFIREWESIRKASIECEINADTIRRSCKGETKKNIKFVWKFKN